MVSPPSHVWQLLTDDLPLKASLGHLTVGTSSDLLDLNRCMEH